MNPIATPQLQVRFIPHDPGCEFDATLIVRRGPVATAFDILEDFAEGLPGRVFVVWSWRGADFDCEVYVDDDRHHSACTCGDFACDHYQAIVSVIDRGRLPDPRRRIDKNE